MYMHMEHREMTFLVLLQIRSGYRYLTHMALPYRHDAPVITTDTLHQPTPSGLRQGHVRAQSGHSQGTARARAGGEGPLPLMQLMHMHNEVKCKVIVSQ